MSRPRILNAEAEGYCSEARIVLDHFAEVDHEQLDRAHLLACLGDYDGLIVRLGHSVDAELLRHGRRLRVVASSTTGLDHIDLRACAERDIAVLSLRGESAFLEEVPATAELTWALLLALLRRLPWAFDDVRRGGWQRDAFKGRELRNRRLGLVGLGRVGRQVAGFGKAFGMEVAAFDPKPERWVEGVLSCPDLPTLLGRSDVLSVHASLDDRSRGMIGAAELALLPANAFLLNTARGELVDESALVAALDSGRLAGAALDVRHHERDPAARAASPIDRFLARPEARGRLLLTPHIGGVTEESMARTEIFLAKKLACFFENLGED